MGGAKYNRLLGNKFITNYKNSMACLSSPKKNLSTTKDNYDYLQQSIIPTYHFQKSLTKLAIPKLDDTINKYLTALKPILSEKEWKEAEASARSFEKTDAQVLDKEIRALDAQSKDSNYISEPWFDMYLRSRDPIVLNYNPFIAHAVDPNPKQMDQAIRATNLLISSIRFMKSLRSNTLKPEIFHLNPEKSDTLFFQRLMRLIPESVSFYGAYMFNAYPLDMSQYFRLFNSTRIPKKEKDVLFTDTNRTHMLVLHKGHFFVFPVLDSFGNILPPEELYACVRHILSKDLKEPESPIGVLTSLNRDTWAGLREKLEELGNQETLNLIDSALYAISLDDVDTNDVDKLAPNFLYGEAKNRWFDKSLTLIVTKNGHSAVNFEHSWGDGVAVLRFFNEIFDDSVNSPRVNSGTKPSFSRGDIDQTVRQLDFKLDDELKSAIAKATQEYKQMTGRLSLKNFESKDYGKNLAKKVSLSPDSIMQSAIQVAYFKTFGKVVTTYESASTAAFKYGRTETIRPATLATKRLSEHLAKTKVESEDDVKAVLGLMQECSKLHNQLVKDGAMGQGFDRHLFAMKYHAVDRKRGQLPEFYTTPAYKLINHNILSTSTLAYHTIQTGGFAPVVPDGFGIGYRILENSLGACVTSYDSGSLKKFAEELESTYDLYYRIFKKAAKKQADK